MKKETNSTEQHQEKQFHNIPDIDIIDLENNDNPFPDEDSDSVCNQPEDEPVSTEEVADEPPRKKTFRINSHIALLAVVLVVVAVISHKFLNWGQFISQDDIRQEEVEADYNDVMDNILPLIAADGSPVYPEKSENLNIVVFGNAPFADDRDSKDNLANKIAEMTNSTVYNCSISGSYLASEQGYPHAEVNPWDAFTLYWMVLLTTGLEVDDVYGAAVTALGENAPPEAAEVYKTLTTLDFDTVDVIAIMYDATDYLLGRPMSNVENPTDIQCFTGNLEAGIEILQKAHPNTRIIVLSPAYAFSDRLDENGDYISSDIIRYGQDVLSSYAIMQCQSCTSRQVTFIDNIYGTIHEDNAKDYLTDNLHLNVKGREKVAQRFIYALNYYRY